MGSGPGSAQFKTQLAPSEPANTQDDELATRLYCLHFPYLILFHFKRSLAWFIALDQDNSGQISAEELRMRDHFPTE